MNQNFKPQKLFLPFLSKTLNILKTCQNTLSQLLKFSIFPNLLIQF